MKRSVACEADKPSAGFAEPLGLLLCVSELDVGEFESLAGALALVEQLRERLAYAWLELELSERLWRLLGLTSLGKPLHWRCQSEVCWDVTGVDQLALVQRGGTVVLGQLRLSERLHFGIAGIAPAEPAVLVDYALAARELAAGWGRFADLEPNWSRVVEAKRKLERASLQAVVGEFD